MKTITKHHLVSHLFPALTILFGIQHLKIFVPLLVNAYGKMGQASSMEMAFIFLLIFSTAFLAPLFPKKAKLPYLILCIGFAISILRLFIQFFQLPMLQFVLSGIGLSLFLIFVPLYLSINQKDEPLPNFGILFLLGLIIDLSLQGLFFTYPHAFSAKSPAKIAASLLFVIHLLTALKHWSYFKTIKQQRLPAKKTFLLSIIAASLFLYTIAWGNLAYLANLLKTNIQTTLLLIMLINLFSLGGAFVVENRNLGNKFWPIKLLPTIGILVSTFFLEKFAFLALIIGPLSLAIILTRLGKIFRQGEGQESNIVLLSISWGVSGLFFAILFNLYHLSFDMNFPFQKTDLFFAAGIFIAILSLGTWGKTESNKDSAAPLPLILGLFLLMLSLSPIFYGKPKSSPSQNQETLRVLTYNLHMGFDPWGGFSLEKSAQVIANAKADVIALQELTQGSLITGGVDMGQWLSYKLGIPYKFTGKRDSLINNAIFTNRPILKSFMGNLPNKDEPLARSFIATKIKLKGGDSLSVINTHLHHKSDADGIQIRQLQIPILLKEAKEKNSSTLIVGDFNFRPNSEEHSLMKRELLDVHQVLGKLDNEGLSFRSDFPHERIDYIWMSPDLKPKSIETIQTTASDHLPVLAEFQL